MRSRRTGRGWCDQGSMNQVCGQVAEWSKAHAWNACRRATVSRVRIPLCPPFWNTNANAVRRFRALRCSRHSQELFLRANDPHLAPRDLDPLGHSPGGDSAALRHPSHACDGGRRPRTMRPDRASPLILPCTGRNALYGIAGCRSTVQRRRTDTRPAILAEEVI